MSILTADYYNKRFFFINGQHGLFLFIFIRFQIIPIRNKTVDYRRIRTRIVVVEGEDAVHLTTATVQILTQVLKLAMNVKCFVFQVFL